MLNLVKAAASLTNLSLFWTPPRPYPHVSPQIMAEYTSLLSDLAENITNEDLEQLKSACKEDIPEDQSNNITSSKEWFSYLEKNDKLAQGEEPTIHPYFFPRTVVVSCFQGVGLLLSECTCLTVQENNHKTPDLSDVLAVRMRKDGFESFIRTRACQKSLLPGKDL